MTYSFIIPVYNAQNTIKRCIDSIIPQLTDDDELILIDDGSMDKSGSICQSYVNSNNNILYFKQKNAGVSSARNAGIEQARKEYIVFIDSDDYIASDFKVTLNDVLCDKELDYILYKFKSPDEKYSGEIQKFSGSLNVAIAYKQLAMAQQMCSCVSSIYKTNILKENNIRFDSRLRIAEDETFLFQYFQFVHSFVRIDRGLYCVDTENQNSLSRRKISDLQDQLILANRLMMDTIKDLSSKKIKKIYLEKVEWSYYRSAYSVCLEICRESNSRSDYIKQIYQVCEMFSVHQVEPSTFKTRILAMPIIKKWSVLIYYIIRIYGRVR